ncbi:MAG TPA: efflux transporter outer membrane subunit [Stellaceae bacterium]|nr:efflux transporter outer membrane subunit [Stellaceae bacterium]
MLAKNGGSRSALAMAAMVAALLGGCTVGPDYVKPDAAVPAAYKEAWKPGPLAKGWEQARPDETIDRGAWWSIYHDSVLDGLERQIDISNQNLKAAEAAFREAEATVTAARAQFFPTGRLAGSATRSRSSGNSAPQAGFGGGISNQFLAETTASWVADLWGSVRRLVESDVAGAQASAATLANARLSAQAQLATAYVELRVADELTRLLEASVKAYAQALRITKNQLKGGTTDQSAVDQAQAQLDATRAQLVAVGVTRGQLEHSIAVLTGKPPAEVTIAPTNAMLAVPLVPFELPSALLQRRPDIAAAERDMHAANALIGVDTAAFYPTVTLSADTGVESEMFRKLFTAPSRVWSLGSSAAETIFDGGARNAQVAHDEAAYDASVATYRQTVLTGLQQVEDELVAERVLAEEAVAEDSAVKAARRAEATINNQYLAGTQAYTAVIVAENTALADEESAVNIRQSRLVASIALIEALGGGWDASMLPSREKIESDQPLNFNPLPPTFPNEGAGITPPLSK